MKAQQGKDRWEYRYLLVLAVGDKLCTAMSVSLPVCLLLCTESHVSWPVLKPFIKQPRVILGSMCLWPHPVYVVLRIKARTYCMLVKPSSS